MFLRMIGRSSPWNRKSINSKENQNGCHVVHPEVLLRIFPDLFIKKLFNDFLPVSSNALSVDLLVYPLHHLVITLPLPNPITAQKHERNSLARNLYDLWLSSHHLFILFKLGIIFVCKIPQSPTEIEVPIYPPLLINLSPSIQNSLLFRIHVWFMVIA